MEGKSRNILIIAIILFAIICPVMPEKVFAGEGRGQIIWIDEKTDDVVTVSFDILKTRRESYGMEFTATKNADTPKNFTSGNYYAQGMIRLARTDELIFRTNGRWIGGNQEKDGGMKRFPFSRDVWHNLKVEFNRSDKVIAWYLDGELLGTTPSTNDKPINAVSVFCEASINDGLQIISSAETTEEETAMTATDTYKYTFRNKQGTNNWYFCEFGDYSEREMAYVSSEWSTVDGTGYIRRGVFQPGTKTKIGAKYIAHKTGVIRLSGTVVAKYADCAKGNGVVAEIFVDNKQVWRGLVTYGNDATYNITAKVKQGEAVLFKIGNNGNYSYDWTEWSPKVEYINADYSFLTDDYTYYQRDTENSAVKTLTYNKTSKRFEGDGGYFEGNTVSPSVGYALGKRFSPLRIGRYRIHGAVTNNSESDVTVIIKKPGEEIRSQMIPKGETGKIDVRAYLSGGETVETEVLFNAPYDGQMVDFNVDVERIVGTMFADESTSQGFSHTVSEEYLLSDLIGAFQGENGMNYYFIYKDIKQEMIYNSQASRWEVPEGRSGGYISKSAGYPGAYTDTLMEWSVPKDGTIRIDGDMFVADSGDGTLCRISKNDEIVWTNRVGGERLVEWDELYDTSYFLNEVNVVLPVSEGDKISFLFDQWRVANNDPADFSDVKISYIDGSILSETTKWKLNRSMVLDIDNKKIHSDGEIFDSDIYSDGENVYVSSKTVREVFGVNPGKDEYVLLGDIAGSSGKNTVEVGDKIAVVYEGLPTQFGYAEIGELNAMLNPTKDWDSPVKYLIVDANGNQAGETVSGGMEYFIRLEAENYVGETYNAKVILAKYDSEGVLTDIKTLAEREIKVGAKYESGNEIGFVADNEVSYVKIFVWNDTENINPLAESARLNITK